MIRTQFYVELEEPEVTITSPMVRWAIIKKIREEVPGAKVRNTQEDLDCDPDMAFNVNVYFDGRKSSA